MTLAIHPYANLFPLIEGQDFYDLAEDIRVNGLRDRIDLIEIDGGYQILDGRNRYRALCWLVSTQAALGPGWGRGADKVLTVEELVDYENLFLYVVGSEEFDGHPLDYVLSKNLTRRHLTDDQRRMVAAKLVSMKPGRQTQTSQIENISRERAADLLSADLKGIDRARAVIAHAAPEISAAVEQGMVSVAAAAEIAAQPIERQTEIIAQLPRDADGKLTPEVKKALQPVIREIRKEKVAAKKERRAAREAETGRRLQALPDKMFGVAIEDFEWDHEPWSRETGSERHPSMHYETAEDAHTPQEIVARCAERFACLADNCVLFKWTTIPHLAIALKVMELQGFSYVTHLVWHKVRSGNARGPGYWFTGEHEIVLVGKRGKVDAPATAHFRSTFSAPVGGHSEKPDNLHEMIEFHWPNTPKVEFNARRRRPGWEVWGYDAPKIADDGEMPSAVDTPAQPAPPPAPEDGKVEPAPARPGANAETAVPPAGRPGADLPPGAHPLDIPPFLRRMPAPVEVRP
jgi:N6-adenosine-specific RNA methylase IME4